MAAIEKIKCHPHMVGYLKKLLFYNKQIKKPKVKQLKNID